MKQVWKDEFRNAQTASAESLALDHLEAAETLLAQLKAITLLAPPETAIGVLAHHSLKLLGGLPCSL